MQQTTPASAELKAQVEQEIAELRTLTGDDRAFRHQRFVKQAAAGDTLARLVVASWDCRYPTDTPHTAEQQRRCDEVTAALAGVPSVIVNTATNAADGAFGLAIFMPLESVTAFLAGRKEE